jgi:outer membrane protein assembly factor BamB
MSLKRTLKVAAPIAALAVTTLHGQVGRGSTEWLTAGGDAQRTFWIRTDPKISVESMSAPGFALQWTQKLDNRMRGGNGLLNGVTANGVTLFVPMSVVAGSSNTVYALDNDTGYVVWQRKFDAAMPAATAQCPGGMTAGPTRIVTLEPPPITLALAGLAPVGGGRAGQTYRSVIGEPGQGVPLEGRGGGGRQNAPAAAPGGAQGARGAGGAPGAAGAGAPAAAPQGGGGGQGRGQQGPTIPGATPEQVGGGGGLGRASGVVYALSSDGVLHVLGLPSGKDIQRPAEFIPSNARWTDTIAVNTTLYATTSGNCGGAPNAIWGIDLASENKPVVSWKNSGGPIVGRVAFATDGTLFAAVGAGTATGDGKSNAIVALDSKTLQVKDWFTQPNAEFVTGPTVFKHNDREVVAAATKDGRVLLLAASSLGGPDHATPLHASTPVVTAGGSIAGNALATWQELTVTAPPPAPAPAPGAAPTPGVGAGGQAAAQPIITTGARWILVPTASGVSSLKVTDSLSLERGWTANVPSPATPIIVNGVVFALASGRATTPAVLHAFDGKSGKQLWTSGKDMKAPAAPGSFWTALSQIYVGTTDGTLHAFGFLDERR